MSGRQVFHLSFHHNIATHPPNKDIKDWLDQFALLWGPDYAGDFGCQLGPHSALYPWGANTFSASQSFIAFTAFWECYCFLCHEVILFQSFEPKLIDLFVCTCSLLLVELEDSNDQWPLQSFSVHLTKAFAGLSSNIQLASAFARIRRL